MKFLKQILDLINSLFKTWPYLVMIIGGIVSAILWLVKVGQAVITLSIPLSLLIVIAALALYPVAKLISFTLQRMKRPPFEFSGLLWKPSIIGYPRPLCLVQGCGQKIFYKIVQPPPVLLVRPNDWDGLNLGNSYVYECPLHGRMKSVPNWPIDELRKKAKSFQQRK